MASVGQGTSGSSLVETGKDPVSFLQGQLYGAGSCQAPYDHVLHQTRSSLSAQNRGTGSPNMEEESNQVTLGTWPPYKECSRLRVLTGAAGPMVLPSPRDSEDVKTCYPLSLLSSLKNPEGCGTDLAVFPNSAWLLAIELVLTSPIMECWVVLSILVEF